MGGRSYIVIAMNDAYWYAAAEVHIMMILVGDDGRQFHYSLYYIIAMAVEVYYCGMGDDG